MNRPLLFVVLLVLCIAACVKGPSDDLLQGTWTEQEGNNSTLVFAGDLFYFYHDNTADTSTFSLDEKHATMWTSPLDSSSGGHSYSLEWHKRKKILVVIGLFPSGLGSASKSYFKKQ